MRSISFGLILLLCLTASARGDPRHLEGGALTVHYVPESYDRYSRYCELYSSWDPITDCDDQNTRVNVPTYLRTHWYVLAAFEEDKEWCQVQFGLNNYDPYLMSFEWIGTKPCYPPDGDGVVIESGG
ncbi:hypothetical protein ACFL6M_05305 [Candidatus Eisenbacteria bacterium]|uniref:Uncharacterized protein n=1 Tax=Eiseniibacteriota bacterium TaxID=2212470 RepID=A0ABV6YL05_UNCEI